jgi:hypothetical protein
MSDIHLGSRRDLLIAPLLVAIPAFCDDGANASPIDPNMTFTKVPDQIAWQAAPNRLPKTVEMAPLWGKASEPGLYYYLVKWYPGERAALVRNRSAVRGGIGHLVGGKRARLRAERHGPDAGGVVSTGASRGRRITTVSRRTVRRPR